MKAVVFHDIGDIRIEDREEPRIERPTDAVVRITASAICGTDLHMIRGTMPGMKKGTVLGHEGVGIVEETGGDVRNLKPGDRVVIPSTIACGYCSYCRAGYYAQCDVANPNGRQAGTAFFGGPASTGPFDGLQSEKALIPFANVGPVRLPEEVSDDQAILISDIFPTGYFGAKLAEVSSGDTVAVFGCGPVGLFAVLSCRLLGAARILAIDGHASRLDKARELGAETINFNDEDPVRVIQDLTGGIGVDRVIDAVGVDAECPKHGPAAQNLSGRKKEQFKKVQQTVTGQTETPPPGEPWKPGDAPFLALEWAVQALAKAGTLGVIGVYSERMSHFPLGAAMMKNLTLNMGNCNHRHYIPRLIQLTASAQVHPEKVLSCREPLTDAVDAYRRFDLREEGWMKVELVPSTQAQVA